MTASNSAAEALFVIHQGSDLGRVGDICRAKGFSSVVILSTHWLLKHERHKASQIATGVQILAFAQLLTDSEMSSCDERSTQDLMKPPGTPRAYRTNGLRFMRNTRRYQNETVHQKIKRMFKPEAVYYDTGLGIDGGYWDAQGATPLTSLPTRLISSLKESGDRIRKRLDSSAQTKLITAVSNGTDCYVFWYPPKRLRLSNRVKIHTIAVPFSQQLAFSLSAHTRRRILARIAAALPQGVGEPRLAATIHQYRPELADMSRPLFLFVDGYHPPNYPRSYLDMYPEDCIFMVNHMFNAGWFKQYHRRTRSSFPVLQPPLMRPVETPPSRSIKRVLLALNHAGDWTSLIQRSDTDILLEAFADTAERCPDLEFIIRPHPTMADPAHEGIHAFERIREYVAWRKLGNLILSVGPLEQDLQRGDLFVSEYSQVLIDALQCGKLGIIANLTARRSFMEPYQQIGFTAVVSTAALEGRIREICANPEAAIEFQNQAVQLYNHRLREEGYC